MPDFKLIELEIGTEVVRTQALMDLVRANENIYECTRLRVFEVNIKRRLGDGVVLVTYSAADNRGTVHASGYTREALVKVSDMKQYAIERAMTMLNTVATAEEPCIAPR